MHPPQCPEWEYTRIEGHKATLQGAIAGLLVDLRSGSIDTRAAAQDTREVHRRLFRTLTPQDHAYYAGHYRGENYTCLKYINVGIAGDPRVGRHAALVPDAMNYLGAQITAGLAALDAANEVPRSQLSDADKLINIVAFACRVFEMFLRIHPYVNGNGHVGRFLIWLILGRYGHWPKQWPIDPRPQEPMYSEMIVAHRNGNREPLEQYVLSCL